ncbi:MAG: uroporphyrinogen decarboxylase family protein, partial [Dehalococcoidia bacterium]
TETLAAYSAACLERGASGIFFATVEWGSADNISAQDYDRFARPFDLRVLAAAQNAPFNLFHVCRDNNHLTRLLDYPVHAFQWGSRSPTNPSLSDIFPKTDKALMGGVDHGHTIREGSPADVAAQAKEAHDATNGRRFLLAPECSIDPPSPSGQTPPENILAMLEAARP